MNASPSPTLRLMLLDDHRLFRDGLRLILEREPGFRVVAQAFDETTARVQLADTQPDLLLADVHLPTGDGITLAIRLIAAAPGLRVVFLSSDANPSFVRRALDAGASGYLLKDSAPQELIHALKAIVDGGTYLSAELTPALLANLRQPPPPSADPSISALSSRELEILRHVAEGLRNKEIADRLQISTKSVETYRSRLMKKLGYDSTAELVRHAIRAGLITA